MYERVVSDIFVIWIMMIMCRKPKKWPCQVMTHKINWKLKLNKIWFDKTNKKRWVLGNKLLKTTWHGRNFLCMFHYLVCRLMSGSVHPSTLAFSSKSWTTFHAFFRRKNKVNFNYTKMQVWPYNCKTVRSNIDASTSNFLSNPTIPLKKLHVRRGLCIDLEKLRL